MRRHLALAAAIVALCVAGWLRHVIGAPYDPRGINSDLTLQYQHLQHWLFERVAAGTLPSWNPYQLAGVPAIATVQGGLYYPGHVFALLLPTPTALGAEILLHLTIAGLGMLAVATRLGLGPTAALTAAAVFVLRGQFLASHGFVTALEAAAWLPVVLAGTLDLAAHRRLRGVVVCAGAIGMSLLAGNTQTTVYVVYVAAGLLVARLAGARASLPAWGTSAGLFATALALGALVAAAQLVPTLELAAQGTRTARALPLAAMFPYGVPEWMPRALLLGRSVGRDLHAFGLVPLLLAAAALGSKPRWVVAWAVLVFVASMGLTLGIRTPIFDVVRWLPALSWFRPKGLALPMAHAAVALLAGLGIQALLGSAGSRGAVARRVLVAALLVAATAEIVTSPVPSSAYRFDAREDADVDFHAPAFAEAAALAGSGRVWFAGSTLQPRFATKLASRHRLRAIDDYEPLNLRRQAEYVRFLTDAALDVSIWQGTVVPGVPAPLGVAPMQSRRRLLDALALKIALVPPGDIVGARTRFLQPAGFRLVRSTRSGVELWENPAALPRAFTVYRTLPPPEPETLLRLLASPSFDPLAVTYVEGAVPPPAVAPPRGDPAAIVVDEEREVVVEATLAAPGFVVLADTACPGWRATVDDRATPILTANYLFRAVAAPAGFHRVRFTYEPWTIPAGLAASLAGVATLLALAWRCLR